MLRKTITYVDFEGTTRTEEYLFNLTKAEIAEMELSIPGGLVNKLQTIVADNDGEQMVSMFKEIILKSYGVKSEDGKRFVKTKELQEEFYQTEAYSELFMELITNPDATAMFIQGILPATQNK